MDKIMLVDDEGNKFSPLQQAEENFRLFKETGLLQHAAAAANCIWLLANELDYQVDQLRLLEIERGE